MSYEGGSDSSAAGGSCDGYSESSLSDAGYATSGSENYDSGDSGSDSGSELYESGNSGSEYDSELYDHSDSDSEADDELYEEPQSKSEEVCEDGDDLNSDNETQENTEEEEDSKEYSEEDSEVVSEENSEENSEEDSDEDSTETEKDAEEVRAEINEKSEYSDEVNDNISSVEELEVYQKANLKEETIDGKKCLVRDDIDWDQKDEFGRTNKQRVEDYDLVPYNKNGEKIELHHIGQKDDSPLAELTFSEHRGKGNDTVLHDKQKETEIDRADFDNVRKAHWKSRAK